MANEQAQDPMAFLAPLLAKAMQQGQTIPGTGIPAMTQQAAPAPQPPLVPPQFPDMESIQAPANKTSAILAGIGDLLRSAASARGRMPQGSSALQRLMQRRDRDTESMRETALQKYGTQQRGYEYKRGRRDTLGDRASEQEREDAKTAEAREWQLGDLQDERDFTRERDKNRAATEKELARIRATGGGQEELALRREMMLIGKKGVLETKQGLAKLLETQTPEEIKENFEDELEIIGIDDAGRTELRLLWEKMVEPALAKAKAKKEEIGGPLKEAFTSAGRTPPSREQLGQLLGEKKGLGPLRDLLSFGTSTAPPLENNNVRPDAMLNQWLKLINQGQ